MTRVPTKGRRMWNASDSTDSTATAYCASGDDVDEIWESVVQSDALCADSG